MVQVPTLRAASSHQNAPFLNPPPPQQISSIQAARGLAVLLVLGMHAATNTWLLTRNPLWEQVHHLGQSIGNAGVDLFFVISGAIMYLVTRVPPFPGQGDRGNAAAAADFLSRRILRIYPLYWLTLPIALMLSDNHFPVTWREITLYVAPIQHPVTWTLPLELRFYAVIGVLLLVARRHLDTAFLVWSAVQVMVCFLAPAGLVTPPHLFENWMMTEFVIGLGVGAAVSRRVVVAPKVFMGMGVLGVAAGAVLAYNGLMPGMVWRQVVFGLPMGALLYGAVTLENTGRLRIPGMLRRIGDISYSIYLWHLLVGGGSLRKCPPGTPSSSSACATPRR